MATMSGTNNSLDSAGNSASHSSVLSASGFVDRGTLVMGSLAESGPGIGNGLMALVVVVHKWSAWILHNTELLDNLGSLGGDNVSAMVAMGMAAVAVTMFIMAMAMARELLSKGGPSSSADKAAVAAVTTAVTVLVMAVA